MAYVILKVKATRLAWRWLKGPRWSSACSHSLHQELRWHLGAASAVFSDVLLSQTLLIPLPLWTLQHTKLCATYIAEKLLLEFSFPQGFTVPLQQWLSYSSLRFWRLAPWLASTRDSIHVRWMNEYRSPLQPVEILENKFYLQYQVWVLYWLDKSNENDKLPVAGQ